MYQHFFL